MTDERHTDPAAREQRIRDAVQSVGDVRADPAFRERLKSEFVSGALSDHAVPHTESGSRRMPRWGWVLLPAAAVAVLLFVLILPRQSPTWSVHGVRGEGQVEVAGRTLAVTESDLMARAIGSGARVRINEGLVLDLILDDHLLLELDEGADVSVPVLPERGDRSLLISEVHAGELRVKTGPGFSGRGLHILTAEGRTEIVGTIVSVYKGDGLTCVCVLEGTARIGADDAGMEEVPSGMRKVMFGDGRPPMVTEIEPHHAAGLIDFVERHQDVFR
jgi:ferric-dicitrate binding protein FerR (iron transport regulator)